MAPFQSIGRRMDPTERPRNDKIIPAPIPSIPERSCADTASPRDQQNGVDTPACVATISPGGDQESEGDDEGSLYEQLIKHHVKENNLDDSGSFGTVDNYSVMSEDERKLPAMPKNTPKGKQRKPIALPYSKHHMKVEKGEPRLYPEPPTVSPKQSPVFPRKKSCPPEIPPVPLEKNGQAEDPIRSQSHDQSPFYQDALDFTGEVESQPPIPSKHAIDEDEKLARELSQYLEQPPSHSSMDEEIAKLLQATEEANPEVDTERDVVLALQLMEQDHQGIDTSADEELAVRLSREMSMTDTIRDEMLARQLSMQQILPQGPAGLVPEQLQILERIQQDKERELIQKALRESCLQDLPDFQEMRSEGQPDMGVGLSFEGNRRSNQDFALSQEAALREWTEFQDRRAGPRFDDAPALRSEQTWAANGRSLPQANSYSQTYTPPRGFDRTPSMTGPAYYANRIPGRAVSVDVRGNETFIDPSARPVQRMRSTIPGPLYADHYLLEPRMPPRQHQDLMRPRPPEDLLRRGHQETQSAIASGSSHVVMCHGCGNRLHAPMNYSLVFCPQCGTVSPGLAAESANRGSNSMRNVQFRR